MAARFEKAEEFDGFDPKVSYQMVPLNGARPMSVVSEADELIISVDDDTIASLNNYHFKTGVPVTPQNSTVLLTPNNRVDFDIVGGKAGNTSITLKKSDGFGVASLTVSVKKVVRKTYALCRLSDRRITCPFTNQEIEKIMPAVAKTYIQQANIQLDDNARGQIYEIVCPEILGDPLFPFKPTVFAAIDARTHATDTGRPIGQNYLIGSADLIVYFAWNIRNTMKPFEVVGLTRGRYCFIEHQGIPNEDALTTGHEIGHGLGLNHTGAKFLMAGDGDSRSSKLQQFEIDMINKTDLTP